MMKMTGIRRTWNWRWWWASTRLRGLRHGARARHCHHPRGDRGAEAAARYGEIGIAFDATSAYAQGARCGAAGRWHSGGRPTPAAIGPFTVPPVNMEAPGEPNVNMVTCGGRRRSRWSRRSARSPRSTMREIVASRRAGWPWHPRQHRRIHPHHRARHRGGWRGATSGKAIIILNPAEPPMIMRDTVSPFPKGRRGGDPRSCRGDGGQGSGLCSGYRLKQEVQFERRRQQKLKIPGMGDFTGIEHDDPARGRRAGDYLPSHSGNLDIMTAAAKATGEAGRAEEGEMSGVSTSRAATSSTFQDVTLRDGMHAIRHMYSSTTSGRLPAIEASGSMRSRWRMAMACRAPVSTTGFGAHTDWEWRSRGRGARQMRPHHAILPGVGTVEELAPRLRHRVRSVRVATHCTEADVSKQHIGIARDPAWTSRAS